MKMNPYHLLILFDTIDDELKLKEQVSVVVKKHVCAEQLHPFKNLLELEIKEILIRSLVLFYHFPAGVDDNRLQKLQNNCAEASTI